jgi:hypothetical protein
MFPLFSVLTGVVVLAGVVVLTGVVVAAAGVAAVVGVVAAVGVALGNDSRIDWVMAFEIMSNPCVAIADCISENILVS